MPRKPRLTDADADLALLRVAPSYGGHPSPLADPFALELVKARLREGAYASDLARELGYAHLSTFSAAFRRRVGESLSAYAARHGVTSRPARQTGSFRGKAPKKPPDRTDAPGLPCYTSLPKRRKPRRKSKKTRSA